MQSQIKLAIARLATFKPTKVMIEADPERPIFVQRYKAYLAGHYVLGPNENDQFGYRLAAMENNPTIYPIDTHKDFPLDYDALQASAKRHGQTAIFTALNAHLAPLATNTNALVDPETYLK